MAGGDLFLGIDGGTESLRAGIFDAKGQLLGSHAAPYTTQFPAPGWAEQRPEDWWAALGAAVKGALAAAGVKGSQVRAMSVDTTCCTVVALDTAGAALRPALLWMDMRSAHEAGECAATGDEALRVNSAGHGPVSAEWMVPKSAWIKRHEPDIWQRAAIVCEYQDYINLRLTGELAASLNNASVRWHYDIDRGWPLSLLQKMDLSDLAQKWPQRILPLGAPVGRLTAEAAAHTGLPEGLLVAQGGADAFIGMIGLGVTAPGMMALLTGSSHLQLGLSDKPASGRGMFGSYTSALIPGLHVVEGGQTSTGSIVAWFKRELCGGSVNYATLNQEAEAVPPGCDGVSCLDHFQGNRTPHTDALSRGAITGLTLAHGRGHVFRSMLEGVAMGTRLILDTMGNAGYRPDSIAIAGGATRSPLWLQLHADICDVPFILTKQTEAPMLGCAILAAVAAGTYPDIPTAAKAMVAIERVVQPRPEVHAQYEEHYRRYCQLYPALKETFRTGTLHKKKANGQPAADIPAAESNGGDGGANGGDASTALQSGGQQQQAAAAEDRGGDSSGGNKRKREQGLQGRLAPSILAADFSRLAEEVEKVLAAGAHWVHVDSFDGSSMANGNLTIGPPVIKALRKALPHAFLDVHLAVDDPWKYIEETLDAGASSITFHIDAPELCTSPLSFVALKSVTPAKDTITSGAPRHWSDRTTAARALARRIRRGSAAGAKAKVGVALSPDTPVDNVLPPLLESGDVDMVLIMSVTPGWGGQKFMPEVLPKIRVLREMYPDLDIQVDGGINATNAAQVVEAGANVLVAGSAVFGARDADGSYTTAVRSLLEPMAQHGLNV